MYDTLVVKKKLSSLLITNYNSLQLFNSNYFKVLHNKLRNFESNY